MSPAWQAGYSGKGVTICIVDDGLDHPHPELADHYVSFYLKFWVFFRKKIKKRKGFCMIL